MICTNVWHFLSISIPCEPKIAQELLRHKNFNTTFSIYAHALDDKKRNCVNQLF